MRRPVEIVEEALSLAAGPDRQLLLAEAGLRQGLPEFARKALDGVQDSHTAHMLGARAAWLADDYSTVHDFVSECERLGTLDLDSATLGARAAWRIRDFRRAAELGRRALQFAMSDSAIPARNVRPLRWMSAYFDAIAGERREDNWLVNSAVVNRWQQEAAEDIPIIGVFDYKGPDLSHASANLGDFIQTVAILRHLSRFRGIKLRCDQQRIHRSLRRLSKSWPEDDRIAAQGEAFLTIFDRDAPQSIAVRFPERPVWAVYNGWFYHKQFGKNEAFPPPDNLQPIPIGFHLWRPSDLTPELIDWLRRHAPIGCRDRNTMRWLLNQNVDAFLSGCPTMTIDIAAEDAAPRYGRCRVDIETGAPGDSEELSHHMPQLRTVPFAESIERAIDRVEYYAGVEEVETSRLHCLLPCQAIGTPVQFSPGKAADRRYEGLIGISENDRMELRQRMTDLLHAMFGAVLAGESVDNVRDRWRGLTAPLVAAAKTELFGGEPAPMLGRVEPADIAPVEGDEAVTVAMAFDAGYAVRARTVLRSIRANSARPIRLVLLVRGLEDEQLEPLSRIAEAVETRIFHMDDRLQGVEVELVQNITISTFDRLFLSELLPDLDRIVYVDCDTIVLGDIGELADHDPGPGGLAARPTPNPNVARIAEMLERRADTLSAEEARMLRIGMAREIDLRQPSFNAGVLVLSLAKLRANGLCERALAFVHRYGLNDQDALNLASIEGYAALPPQWNSMPQFDLDPDAAILHWVGARKPWMKTKVLCQEQWRRYEADAEPARDCSSPIDKVTKESWLDPEAYRPDWDERARMAARWISPGAKVLDLGCGARLSLRDCLPADCVYQGLDQRSWNDDVIAMDLDTGEFPLGRYDVAVMLGLLEYLEQPAAVLARAGARASALIVSYCHPCANGNPDLREKRGWINAFGAAEFVRMLEEAGWQVDAMDTHHKNENIRQLLYSCSRP